jgi:hypothetical protein
MAKPNKPKKKQKRSVNKKPAFLKAFIACGDLTRAAAAIGMDRSNHYDWLEKDPAYVKAFARAEIQAGQTLEDDAVHWARVGVFDPLVYQGQFQFAQRQVTLCLLPDGREVREEDLPQPIGDVQVQGRRTITENFGAPLGVFRRSEGLMGRLLKRFFPERYGDRVSAELSGPGGGPIPLEDKRLKNLTDEELLQLIAVARKLTSDSGDGGGTPPPPPK